MWLGMVLGDDMASLLSYAGVETNKTPYVGKDTFPTGFSSPASQRWAGWEVNRGVCDPAPVQFVCAQLLRCV